MTTAAEVRRPKELVVRRDEHVTGGTLADRRREDAPEQEEECDYREAGWARRTHKREGRLPSDKGLLCVSQSNTEPSIRKDKNRPWVSWRRGSPRFVEAAPGRRRPRPGIRAGLEDPRVDRPLRVRGPRIHRARGPRIRERGDDRGDRKDPPHVRLQGVAEPVPERVRHLDPRAADDLQAGGAEQGQGTRDRPPRGNVREARHAPRGPPGERRAA